jgi:hypothetical protein
LYVLVASHWFTQAIVDTHAGSVFSTLFVRFASPWPGGVAGVVPRLVYLMTLLGFLAVALRWKAPTTTVAPALLAAPLSLVGGEGVAPLLALLMLHVRAVAVCDAVMTPRRNGNDGGIHSQGLSSFGLVMIALGSWASFYATGHDSKFSRLRIGAAFVGFDSFDFYTSGCMLMLDTVGAVLLTSIASACAVCERCALERSELQRPRLLSGRKDGGTHVHDDNATSGLGTCDEVDSAWGAWDHIVWILLSYSLVCALSTLFVGLQRRHLMVWAIFAPKYAFDLTLMACVDAVALVVLTVASLSKGTPMAPSQRQHGE